MLRKVFLFFVATVVTAGVFAQSGALKGTVKNAANGETVPFANISIERGGSIITGGMTDFDGNYTIKPIPPGKYTVKCSYVGFNDKQYDGVIINSDKITFLDFSMSSGIQLQEVQIYAKPLIDPDQVQQGGSIGQEEIKKMPGRDADEVASTVAGVYSEDGNISSIRGSREEGTVYYIDGVKVRGSKSLPKSAMADVTVITGGVPAKYGDATGGIVSITSASVSEEYNGALELVGSLDAYGNYLAEGMFTGPLLYKSEVDRYDTTKINRKPIVGFFLSGSAGYVKDQAPRATGVWQATPETLEELKETPIVRNPYGFGVLYPSLYYDSTRFENVKAHSDLGRFQALVQGKVDYKPSSFLNITVGGNYDYQKGRNYSYANTMFNSENNGEYNYNNWRAYVRLTHRFEDKMPDEEGASADLIKNAFYRIQVDYSKTTNTDQDMNHQDNLFKYGYLGKFETSKVDFYEYTDTLPGYPNGVYLHTNFMDTAVHFTPSDANPDLAHYTEMYYDTYPQGSFYRMNLDNLQNFGALLNGSTPGSVYGMYTSPGTPYASYSKSDAGQFRVSAAGSFDIKNHEISLGFEFEQRSDYYYGVSPVGLWTLARQMANLHILELDIENPNYIFDDNGVFMDSVHYNRLYNATNQTLFDINLRDHLGLSQDDLTFLDIDSYDPEDLSVSYFAPDELFNSGNSYVTYYGFDHTGKKLKNKPSFADFFNDVDDYGKKTRLIAPFEPTYSAVYIQDKFSFRDLVFNVGLRVDRYDANQMVPKDPYVLAETYTAGDQNSIDLAGGSHPDGVQDDWVVYVDDIEEPTAVSGYRDGDFWYDANGAPIDDPDIISTATGIAPYLVSGGELTENAFEDYKPQITPMPRVSFSFPISDEALFFAHYDVLANRPTPGYNRMNPVSYLYIEADPNYISNPNLKPQKTIDYELGFEQAVSDGAKIKLSAFYREMRDMVQIIRITGGYPTDYTTYGNMDFGTVKGFSGQFQMRRSGNITLRANYTLQFANGSGSDPNTAANLINQGFGNIRFTNPLNFDQRHQIQAAVDYRFGGKVSGRPYTGPKIREIDILADAGASLVVQAGSGKPYNKRDIRNDYLIGSINGSRMPWSNTINIRFDKDMKFQIGGKGDDGDKKDVYLNVYFDISNILNTANVRGVHSWTGNPDDDGYLHHADSQTAIENQYDEAAYRNYYAMYINYPWNYSRPRTILMGAMINF